MASQAAGEKECQKDWFFAEQGQETLSIFHGSWFGQWLVMHSTHGLLRDSAYSNFHCEIGNETLFVLFTDGIIEALNFDEEEFGLERLRGVIAENLHGSVSGINGAVVDELRRFTGGTIFLDDICLLTVENTENSAFEQDVNMEAGHNGAKGARGVCRRSPTDS